MKYRIKNISSWINVNPAVSGFMNDEVHEISDELAKQGLRYGAIDPVGEDVLSMEEMAKPKEEPKNELKNELECECGFIAKSKAGLLAHKRKCKFTQQS